MVFISTMRTFLESDRSEGSQVCLNVQVILFQVKKNVCVIVLCFMRQFGVDNLRTLLICQHFAKI